MKITFAVILFWLPLFAFCQDALSGKVVSEEGKPLSGASVFISNTTNGTATNANGEFILSHLPAGSFTLVVSFVGYETTTVNIADAAKSKRYVIRLQPGNKALKAVVIGNYDKGGWKKWGGIFTDAFIGTSQYGKACTIRNRDVIHFTYNKTTNQLHAFAEEPVVVENTSLGYSITVTLLDFNYDIENRLVDYEVYNLFKEMDGNDEKQSEWNENRQKVYTLFLLHFMRALYEQNTRNEGYQVRVVESTPNAEKQRVKKLFKETFSSLKDSLDDLSAESLSEKQLEKQFPKDSVLYYQTVLKQEDRTQIMHFDLANLKSIVTHTDSNTMILHFDGYLQVVYNKMKEPKEYFTYKNKQYLDKGIITRDDLSQLSPGFPTTLLSLSRGIPVEILENGHFANIDLFADGFWGWWERIGTALPYEYEP